MSSSLASGDAHVFVAVKIINACLVLLPGYDDRDELGLSVRDINFLALPDFVSGDFLATVELKDGRVLSVEGSTRPNRMCLIGWRSINNTGFYCLHAFLFNIEMTDGEFCATAIRVLASRFTASE